MPHVRYLSASLIALIAFHASLLHASLLHAAEVPPIAEGAGGEAGDIVVTAQRRSENLQKVPLSVTAITPARISDLNIRSIQTLETVTPGMVFNTGAGFAQVYIRGVGTELGTPGLESPVAIYVDGAYSPRSYGVLHDLLDPASVQVLKGAQGTLYGRNATAGAILVDSANPARDLSFNGTAEAGRFGHYLGEGTVNIPVSDTLALRVAGRYTSDRGYVRNITTGTHVLGQHKGTIRAKAKWDPTADFSAVLTFSYNRLNMRNGTAARNAVGAPYCIGCAFGGDYITGPYQVTEDLDSPFSGTRSKGYSGNLQLSYKMGVLNFKTVTAFTHQRAYNSIDADHTSLPLLAVLNPHHSDTFTQDFQVSSDLDGPINFLAGAQYINDTASITQFFYGIAVGNAYGDANTASNFARVKTEAYAGFLEGYLKPIDRVTLTLGGRYTVNRRHLTGATSPLGVALFNPGGPTSYTAKEKDEKFTPRIVLAYDAGIVNLYGSFTRGFKSGGFNTPQFNPPANEIRPETMDSYEAGAKFVSPDRRLRANLSIYRYNYKDLQVVRVNQLGTGNSVQNAASARGKGFEAELSYQPLTWLSISAGTSYTDAKYRKYLNAPVLAIARNGAGVPIGLTTVPTDLSGTPLTRAPKWMTYLSADAKFPITGDFIGKLAGVVTRTSSYLFAPAAGGELGLDRQPRTTLVNLSGGVGPSSNAYEIGFYIDNLTDKKYYAWAYTSALNSIQYPAAPRTYGVRVKVLY